MDTCGVKAVARFPRGGETAALRVPDIHRPTHFTSGAAIRWGTATVTSTGGLYAGRVYTQLDKTRHKIAIKLDKIKQAFGALKTVLP